MVFAVSAWFAGITLLVFFLLLFLKRANIAAIAVLLILVPQVFARPVMFFLGLDEPFPYEYFNGPDWILIATGLLAAAGWILIFSLTHLYLLHPLARLGALMPRVRGRLNINVLILTAAATTLVGAVLTGRLVSNSGSLAHFMYSVKVEKELTGSYVIREVSVVGAIFSAIGIVYCEHRYRAQERKKHGRGTVLFFLALFAVNLAFNYFWANRYNIAMLMLTLGTAWHFYVKPIKISQLVGLVLIAAIALQGLKMHRNAAVEVVLEREIDHNQSFWLDISTSLHFNQFDAFILALRDAGDRFEFRNGRDFKNGLLSWIPRELYPEKENFHVGQWFRQIYEPDRVNGWPVTTMGSWYVNFGIAGILLGATVSGVFAAVFDAGYRDVTGSAWQATIAPALAFLMFDGGVGTGFAQDVFLVMAPIYLLAFVLNLLRSPTRKSDTDFPEELATEDAQD